MKKTVVVISGPPGSGNSTVGKKLAKKMKLKFLSFGTFHKGLLKGWKKEEAKAALEVWKTPIGASDKTHRDRDALQVKLAKKGGIVIESKLGIHFLKRLSKFKIWLDVPLKVRAERTAKRDKIPVEQALRQVAEREEIERREWKRIYGFDYLNQKYDADFVLDSSKLTINQTVNKILEFIKGKKQD